MNESLIIKHDSPELTWQGAVSLRRTKEWTMPWRLPHDRLALFPPEALQEKAAMPAGVRIAFHTNSTTVAGAVEPEAESTFMDLHCDGVLCGSQEMSGGDAFRFEGLPEGEKLVELWLPQFGRFRLRHLALDQGANVRPYEDIRPRWITYGSSITQCRAAASPSRTWPAIVAREHGLDLTCLGYGGQCHLDPMIARVIRDTPADYISLCLGINIYGAASLSERAFRPAIIGFVSTIREGHPDIPLVVMSPIYSPERERTPNAVGLTLVRMREEVSAAVEALRSCGDKNVHYVDGLRIFGADSARLLPDDLHPNAEGYELMGKNFLREVAYTVFSSEHS